MDALTVKRHPGGAVFPNSKPYLRSRGCGAGRAASAGGAVGDRSNILQETILLVGRGSVLSILLRGVYLYTFGQCIFGATIKVFLNMTMLANYVLAPVGDTKCAQ